MCKSLYYGIERQCIYKNGLKKGFTVPFNYLVIDDLRSRNLLLLTTKRKQFNIRLQNWITSRRDNESVYDVPETEHGTNDSCSSVINTGTYTSPLATVKYFQTSFSWTRSSNQSHCEQHNELLSAYSSPNTGVLMSFTPAKIWDILHCKRHPNDHTGTQVIA